MENLACPQCGHPIEKESTVCGACGRDVKNNESPSPSPSAEAKPGRKKVLPILVVLLVIIGGVALLMYTGLLPNPMKGMGTAAIVNGEKISVAEVDQKMAVFKKMAGQGSKADLTTAMGKEAEAGMRIQILNMLIQEKILDAEAAREKITVSPREIADRIVSIKQDLNLSDKDFEAFLKGHAMTRANFEKRVGKDLLIAKLMNKVMKEKGLTPEAWLNEINKKAKVEIIQH